MSLFNKTKGKGNLKIIKKHISEIKKFFKKSGFKCQHIVSRDLVPTKIEENSPIVHFHAKLNRLGTKIDL